MQEIGHLIDPVSTAARGEASQLGHKVPVGSYIPSSHLDLERKTYAVCFLSCDPILPETASLKLILPGDPAGQLLRSTDCGISRPGLEAPGPPAADDHLGPDQDPVRVCPADALCCQGRRWKSKGTK